MSCPAGTTLQNGLCYGVCPTGYTSVTESIGVCFDDRTCDSYGIGLTVDPNSVLLCDKPAPLSVPCTAGYTQFGTDCYIRCPPSMTENSNTCIKRLFILTGVEPTCPTGFEWTGTNCITSTSFWILLVLSVALLLALLYGLSWLDSSRVSKITLQSGPRIPSPVKIRWTSPKESGLTFE